MSSESANLAPWLASMPTDYSAPVVVETAMSLVMKIAANPVEPSPRSRSRSSLDGV
jgi:hypothetical protein